MIRKPAYIQMIRNIQTIRDIQMICNISKCVTVIKVTPYNIQTINPPVIFV